MKRARALILALVLALALAGCMPAGARKMCKSAAAFPSRSITSSITEWFIAAVSCSTTGQARS